MSVEPPPTPQRVSIFAHYRIAWEPRSSALALSITDRFPVRAPKCALPRNGRLVHAIGVLEADW